MTDKLLNSSVAVQLEVSFVVPCYNEARNVTGTVGEIEAAARKAGLTCFEIIIVDDCSTDDTGKIISRLAAENPRIVPVFNADNFGFGGAYKEGMKRAAGIYIIMIHGDNIWPSNEIAAVLREAGKADIVVPYTSNLKSRPWFRRLVSIAFTKVMNLLFGLELPYYNGIVLHRRCLLNQIEIQTDGFAYQVEALIKLIRDGATYTTIGIEVKEHNAGSSAFKLKNIYRVLKTIVTLWLDINVH